LAHTALCSASPFEASRRKIPKPRFSNEALCSTSALEFGESPTYTPASPLPFVTFHE